MKLQQIMEGLQYTGTMPDIDVESVVSDSRQLEQNSVFVCIKGLRVDGHDMAQEAMSNGAVAVVCERDLGLPNQLIVENTRHALTIMCGNLYGNPARKLKLIGVTGTNGKTTTVYMLKQLLEHAGKKVGLIGTIQNEIGDVAISAKYTTPEPNEFNLLLTRMLKAGCEYVVMEVSSQALDQHRMDGIHFEVGVFSNLTRDHLDYHGDMEHYFEAKRKLFDLCDTAVLNWDDPYGRRLAESVPCKVVTYSVGDDTADYTARDLRIAATGNRFVVVGRGKIGRVSCRMPGRFSASNAMAAATALIAAGIDFDTAVEGLSYCKSVKGRAEVLDTDTDFVVVCDYAHSPDSYEKILSTFKEFCEGRLVVVFGCAGARDHTKRPPMGEMAGKYADFLVVSSDNPRDEDPMEIIRDVMPGVLKTGKPYVIYPNRYDAIEWALDFCQKGDILMLLGKGHEDYQLLDYGTIRFDEPEVVQRLLRKKREREGQEG